MPQHTVLVVDDDVDISTNVCDILTEFGYRADMAHDGASALELVRRQQYDVALLDFKMPDMDGATLYEKIKEVQPSLVAIMITAYAGSDGVERAKNAGTWQVLRKPVDLSMLMELLGQACDQPVVLLVDDDKEFCQNMWQILREHGYRVAIAHDQEGALSCVGAHAYDAVILDLILGATDSLSILEQLKSRQPCPPTVMITGDRSSEASTKFMEKGVKHVEFKPLDVKSFIGKVAALIDKRQAG